MHWLVLLLIVSGCRASAPSADAGSATPVVKPPPNAIDGGPPVEPGSFAGYAAFSSDGLVFAYAREVNGALGMEWLSSTTNTVEKALALDTPAAREKAAAELADEGFPKPGSRSGVPPMIAVALREGQVVVTFGGMPAGKPFKPFPSDPDAVPQTVTVAAVSRDGKHVGVRVAGNKGDAGTVIQHRVVTLFE